MNRDALDLHRPCDENANAVGETEHFAFGRIQVGRCVEHGVLYAVRGRQRYLDDADAGFIVDILKADETAAEDHPGRRFETDPGPYREDRLGAGGRKASPD